MPLGVESFFCARFKNLRDIARYAKLASTPLHLVALLALVPHSGVGKRTSMVCLRGELKEKDKDAARDAVAVNTGTQMGVLCRLHVRKGLEMIA